MALASCFGGGAVAAFAQTSPAQDVRQLTTHLDAAQVALEAGDVRQAQTEYAVFSSGWVDIEDGVRAQSRDNYRAIERAMRATSAALQSGDIASSEAALEQLDTECDAFIGLVEPRPAEAAGQVTLTTQIEHLDRALARIDANDAPGAALEVDVFRRD